MSTVFCLLLLAGCGLGYYWQATTGHLELMRLRRPVSEVVADPTTPPELRDKLEMAARAVNFAHEKLSLPDNGSYRSYADIGRRYVVWNVFAAPEFSLEPRTWCFPVAGCVGYRGYFEEAAARDFAAGLDARGDDIYIGGVAAYSTLGRFADPLLNTMMAFPDYELASLVFHELAHQQLYAKGDSKFNEGFASFMEQEGVDRWLRSIGGEAGLRSYRLRLERLAEARVLVSRARDLLAELYGQNIAIGQKRAAKKEIFAGLHQDYVELRGSWDGPPYLDAWFDAQANNAGIAAMVTYDEYVAAFRTLLERHGGDLNAFYVGVAELAALAADDRVTEMQALLEDR